MQCWASPAFGGYIFQVLFSFSFWVLFFLVYCLAGFSSCLVASVAFWLLWLPWLFGSRSFQGASVASVAFGVSGFCGFTSVASSCIRVQVSRGPEYGSKASEKTRGEQEAIWNLEKLIAFSSALTSSRPFLSRKLGSDQLFTVDISTVFFLGEAPGPPPNPLPLSFVL